MTNRIPKYRNRPDGSSAATRAGVPRALAGAVSACLALCIALGLGAFPPPNTANIMDKAPAYPGASPSPYAPTQAEANGAPRIVRANSGAEYWADQLLVELEADTPARIAAAQLEALDYVQEAPLSDKDATLGWALVSLVPGTNAEEAAAKLAASGIVAGAQPNFVYRALGETPAAADSASPAPSASLAASAFVATSSAWHLTAIGAATAWQTQTVDKAVTVAVIDSGCDTSHIDLRDNIVGTYNALNGGKNVSDANGHGTHVAGIIAASAENGTGVDGVSHDAGLLPIKVMKDDTTDTLSLIKAYRYVIDNAKRFKVRVVNMSLGAEQVGLDAQDEALMRAVDNAYRSGILSVFAAGNDDAELPYYCFPCDFSEVGVGVINVGTDYASVFGRSNGLPDESSNYNMPGEKTKDLSAPGVDILSTAPGNDYEEMTGTSMAAPMVAGVAALVFAANPSLDAGEAKSVLCSTAQDLVHWSGRKRVNVGFDQYTGYGLVRADKAVQGAADTYLTGGDALTIGASLTLSVPRAGTWKWSSDNEEVATVSASTGLVRGIGPGEAVISATDGTTTIQRTIVVYQVKLDGAGKVAIGKSTRLAGWANPVAAWTYSSSDAKIATAGKTSGKITGKKTGTVTISAALTACPAIKVSKKVKVVKAANPLAVKAKTKTVERSHVKKKTVSLSGCIAFTKKGKGAIAYAKVAKNSSTRLSVNKKSGKVKVKKGTKRGTYTIRVKVKAAGTAKFKAASKTVTVKVVVR